jgi:Protein of unknown function (DUF3662)/FHA domain
MAFKAEVQPVEIAGALQRECDDRAAIVSRTRTMVPNDFAVELSARDHERLSGYADPLRQELTGMIRDYAKEQRYMFIGPVEVHFEKADDLTTGMFRIRSQAIPGVIPAEDLPAPPGDARANQAPGAAPPTSVWLEIHGAHHPLNRPVITVGRGSDTDLRIDDPGVSRQHAQIRLSPHPTIVDLNSTNGVIVNGRRVQHAPLQDGTTIVLGSTTLVFRNTEG